MKSGFSKERTHAYHIQEGEAQAHKNGGWYCPRGGRDWSPLTVSVCVTGDTSLLANRYRKLSDCIYQRRRFYFEISSSIMPYPSRHRTWLSKNPFERTKESYILVIRFHWSADYGKNVSRLHWTKSVRKGLPTTWPPKYLQVENCQHTPSVRILDFPSYPPTFLSVHWRIRNIGNNDSPFHCNSTVRKCVLQILYKKADAG